MTNVRTIDGSEHSDELSQKQHDAISMLERCIAAVRRGEYDSVAVVLSSETGMRFRVSSGAMTLTQKLGHIEILKSQLLDAAAHGDEDIEAAQ